MKAIDKDEAIRRLKEGDHPGWHLGGPELDVPLMCWLDTGLLTAVEGDSGELLFKPTPIWQEELAWRTFVRWINEHPEYMPNDDEELGGHGD